MPTTERLYNVKRILELYEKLDRESLVAQELEELVQLSSALYEKALILRFKAAEERIFGPNGEKNKLEAVAEPKVELPSEIGEIDFSIFEKAEEEIESPEILFEADEQVVEATEDVQDEPAIVHIEEKIEEEVDETPTIPEETSEKKDSNDWASFFEKVFKDHATGIQTPLHALAGSFGLNERILYINELFDGQAEKFSEFIQKMDKLENWLSGAEVLSRTADQWNWEKDNDVTGEFILHVKRRYA